MTKSNFWYNETINVHEAVCKTVRYLDQTQAHNAERNLRNLRLYGNNAITSLRGTRFAHPVSKDKLSLNVVQAVVDAAVAQIATNKPRVYNLTANGTWEERKRAKLRNQFNDGMFDQVGQYAISRRVFQDACIFGTGVEKVGSVWTSKGSKIACERVFPDDILVDDREGRMGKPCQYFQCSEVSRSAIVAWYGEEFAKAAEEASNDIREMGIIHETTNDFIGVIEAWKLPSYEGADDGRHVVVINTATLVDEPWTETEPPFVFFRWGEAPLGFWGWGLSDRLVGIQIEINYLLQKMQRCMTLAAPSVWVQEGTKINLQSMDNTEYAVRKYSGALPVFMNAQAISPEYAQHLMRLYDKAFEITGVSQMWASAEKPANLSSGKALDSYNDIQTKRFLHIGQEYENFHVNVADKMACVAARISEDEGAYPVLAKTNKEAAIIDWKEVELDRDRLISQPYPTALLPQTPAGKSAEVRGLMQDGLLSKEEALSLLDYPDLQAVSGTYNSAENYLSMVVEEIIHKGNAMVVDPYSNLALAMQRLPRELLRAEVEGAPEEHLDLMRAYIMECSELLQQQTVPQVAAQAAPMQESQQMQQAQQTQPNQMPVDISQVV